MKTTVNYFGQLRQITNAASEECELGAGGSVQDLIHDRARAHGEDFERIVLGEDGNLRQSLMVLHNGRTIDKTQPAALEDGDEVSLLPAIAGG